MEQGPEATRKAFRRLEMSAATFHLVHREKAASQAMLRIQTAGAQRFPSDQLQGMFTGLCRLDRMLFLVQQAEVEFEVGQRAIPISLPARWRPIGAAAGNLLAPTSWNYLFVLIRVRNARPLPQRDYLKDIPSSLMATLQAVEPSHGFTPAENCHDMVFLWKQNSAWNTKGMS